MRTSPILALTHVTVAVLLAGCGLGNQGIAPTYGSGAVPKSATQPLSPGSLISTSPFTDVDPVITDGGSTAIRLVYRSNSGIDQSSTIVTGVGFIPPGKPPFGGWPIVALAHGSTGIRPECGPSQYPDLMGLSAVVADLLAHGQAVAVTDYQGLGGPGAHPYLDSMTAGYNVIDSARALRGWSADVSSNWAAYGVSQGGAAVWAANELASARAPELRLVGSVSIVPPVDMSPYPTMAAALTLNPEQKAAYIWLLAAMANTRPGFELDQYRHDIAPETWQALLTCTEVDATARVDALSSLNPEQIKPSTPEAEASLTSTLAAMALPQRRASAPMLVYYGGRDPYIEPQWIESAITRACALGSRIASVYQPDRGHDDIDTSAVSGWLAARFDGAPAPTTCPK